MSSTDSSAALVSLRNVSKRFANGTLALQGMSLNVGEHDFISFLGPSGCGKSTALRLVAGLTRISSGEMQWSSGAAAGQGAGKIDRDLGFVGLLQRFEGCDGNALVVFAGIDGGRGLVAEVHIVDEEDELALQDVLDSIEVG